MAAAVRPQIPLGIKLIDPNGLITQPWSLWFTGVATQLGTPGSVPVYSFNTRTGNIVLTYDDITGALLFTPVNANAAVITGGTIDGTAIGNTNAAAAQFTTIHVSGQLTSTATTGIAPFVVNSASPVIGLNTTGNAGTATLAVLANTATYANTAGSVTWANVSLTPTTLAGYGITDAPTKTGTGASGTWLIDITGNATYANTSGTSSTVTSAAQPAITSVGTLSNIVVSGTALVSGGIDKLTTTTGNVNVGLSAAPAIGDVLTATSATTATWQPASGGGGGGPTNGIFYTNDQIVSVSYTLPVGKNAVTAGTISINSNVVVTLSTGSTWVIV